MTEQLANIERTLGEIQGTLRAVHRELERDRQDSKESRERMYKRIAEVDNKFYELEQKIESANNTAVMAGQVAAQARDATKATDQLIKTEVVPQTNRLKSLGTKGAGFLAGVALAGGLMSAPLFTSIASALEKVFKS